MDSCVRVIASLQDRSSLIMSHKVFKVINLFVKIWLNLSSSNIVLALEISLFLHCFASVVTVLAWLCVSGVEVMMGVEDVVVVAISLEIIGHHPLVVLNLLLRVILPHVKGLYHFVCHQRLPH